MRRRSSHSSEMEEPLLGGDRGGGAPGGEAAVRGAARTPPPAAPAAPPPTSSTALTPWSAPASVLVALWDFLHRAVAAILGPLCPPALRPPPKPSPRAAAAAAGLAQALTVRYDQGDPAHAAALAALWAASFPSTPPPDPVAPHPRWREAGWQGDDPRTDLRGGGLAAVRAALHWAREHAHLWRRLRHKDRGGDGGGGGGEAAASHPPPYVADPEYPFGAAGVAVTVLTSQAAGLVGGRGAVALPRPPGPPATASGRGFVSLLDVVLSEGGGGAAAADGAAADAADADADADVAVAFALWADLAAAAYERLDRDWVAGRAGVMQFPALAEGVRVGLERALGRRGLASVGEVRAALGLEP